MFFYRQKGNRAQVIQEEEVESLFGIKRIKRKVVLEFRSKKYKYFVDEPSVYKAKRIVDWLNKEGFKCE
jgi:hypothetical protein